MIRGRGLRAQFRAVLVGFVVVGLESDDTIVVTLRLRQLPEETIYGGPVEPKVRTVGCESDSSIKRLQGLPLVVALTEQTANGIEHYRIRRRAASRRRGSLAGFGRSSEREQALRPADEPAWILRRGRQGSIDARQGTEPIAHLHATLHLVALRACRRRMRCSRGRRAWAYGSPGTPKLEARVGSSARCT